jgi:4-oxalocrotonate tautomerase
VAETGAEQSSEESVVQGLVDSESLSTDLGKQQRSINEENSMPLVRIDLPESIDADTARRIGETVHKVMGEVINVPSGDKFQVITRHPPEGRNLTAEYLGIRYSDHLVLIQITLNEGRTLEMKKNLYRRVADDLAEVGLRRQDVVINLLEVAKENWSFGNGEMQYGPR